MKIEIDKLIRENIKTLKPYSSARDDFKGKVKGMVFLDANENPYGNGLNRYPDPHQTRLKSIISEIKNIPPDHILIGNGSDEVLDLIVRIFCEPNRDQVVIMPPTYGMYQVVAGVNAVDVLKIPLDESFQPNVAEILKASDNTAKILFICSPNNPSGNSIDKSIIEELLNGFNGIVVIDEAYIDFSTRTSWLSELNRFPNLIVTQTLSKAYGLAGIRLGMCFASPFIIDALNKIKPPYNVNALSQERAIAKLNEQHLVKDEINAIIEERAVLRESLTQIDFINHIFPSDANFLLVAVDDAKRRYRELIELGVVARDRSDQPGCENCLRFTVGTKKENQILINALTKLI